MQNREEGRRIMDQSDFPSRILQQRMIGENSFLIKEGLIADRPSSPQLTKFYYASDEDKLYHYNKSTETWTSVALT